MAKPARKQEELDDVAQAAPPTPVKPPLKWAGGKRWLVPILARLYELTGKQRFVEPFAGGMASALGLQPTHAILNDINPHVVNFYRSVQKGLPVTIEFKNDRVSFDAARKQFNELTRNGQSATQEAALLFYYLNRTGFNGLCRFNSKGEFNVPFGSYKSIPYKENFNDLREVIASWEFTSTDFEEVPVAANDFVYADPPYDVEFTQYSKEDFSWDDQMRLANWLAALPCSIVVSNQATARIVSLYEELGFSIYYLRGPRRIACNGDRTPAPEIVATKNISGCAWVFSPDGLKKD